MIQGPALNHGHGVPAEPSTDTMPKVLPSRHLSAERAMAPCGTNHVDAPTRDKSGRLLPKDKGCLAQTTAQVEPQSGQPVPLADHLGCKARNVTRTPALSPPGQTRRPQFIKMRFPFRSEAFAQMRLQQPGEAGTAATG